MSVPLSVYVGPFAQWLVTSLVERGALRELLEAHEGALYTNALGMAGEPPEVEVEGVQRLCYCFMPDTERPDQPARQMWFAGAVQVVEDLTEVEPKVEMDWFAGAFAAELQSLAGFFGEAPTIHWGLLVWAS